MLHYLAWLSASCTDYVTLPKIWTHVECKITDAIIVAEQRFTLVTSVYPTISAKPNQPRSFSFLKHIIYYACSIGTVKYLLEGLR